MKLLLLAICITFCAGCLKPALQKAQTSNSNFTVHLLFEHDGVKVYRFYDNGEAIYYTDARGNVNWTVSTGEHTERKAVPTAQ